MMLRKTGVRSDGRMISFTNGHTLKTGYAVYICKFYKAPFDSDRGHWGSSDARRSDRMNQ